jgi:hypothetical protein
VAGVTALYAIGIVVVGSAVGFLMGMGIGSFI